MNRSSTQRREAKGFTLAEILITITIIAVITGVAVPLIRSGIASSRQATCLGKLRGIGVALESYLQEHNNLMPTLEAGRTTKTDDIPVLDNTLEPYLPSGEAYHCPADRKQFEASGSSYIWNSTQNGQSKLNLKFFGFDVDSTRIPLVTDKEAWHSQNNGVNILYADYSVSRDVRFITINP
jgi:prepilin-type N-terminal cleavage/methylation domain-containing protein